MTTDKETDKKYPVGSEIVGIFSEAAACRDCRDSAAKGFFKYQLKNAIFFSKKATGLSSEAWEAVWDVYPELRGKKLEYRSSTKEIAEI